MVVFNYEQQVIKEKESYYLITKNTKFCEVITSHCLQLCVDVQLYFTILS
jgi:hypothetical protein